MINRFFSFAFFLFFCSSLFAQKKIVYVLPIKEEIGPISSRHIKEGFNQAEKAKADFIYVYANDNKVYAAGSNKEGEKINSNDMISLTEAIVKLKTQINKLNEDNAVLKKQLAIMETGARTEDASSEELSASNKKMQKQIESLKFSNDSLIKLNNQLKKYKEIVSGNENSDLIISLSSSLQKEKAGNLMLNNQNKLLLDSIRNMKGLPPEAIKENKTSPTAKQPVKKTEAGKPKEKKKEIKK